MPTSDAYRRAFEGGLEQLSAIRAFVGQAATELGAGEDDVFACQLAADEAAANAFEHAYAGQGGRVEVSLWRQGDAVLVCVRNWGTPFDPDAIPQPDLDLPLAEREAGGLGIYLMRQVMDEVVFRFDAEEGNSITMRRRIRPLDQEPQ
jgi:serine/threonine-protein kinase RsbW